MELGTIEREVFVGATPEVVYDVVSKPEHVRAWWPDDARYDPVPGSVGELVFGDPDAGGDVVAFTVVEAQPPHTFTFRWTQPAGEVARAGNSLLVTFALTAVRGGTLLRMTETGFRELGAAAVAEERYQDHASGWDHFLPRLASYAATLTARP